MATPKYIELLENPYTGEIKQITASSIQLIIKLQLISILCYTSTVERYNSNEQGKITDT